MKFSTLVLSLALPLVWATASSPAAAEHADIFLTAHGGALATGGWDDESNALIAESQRVFAADLGKDPRFPFAVAEPGIHSDLVGSTVSFSLLGGLCRWNGVCFEAAPNHMVSVEHGPQFMDSSIGGSMTFDVGEGFHIHPSYFLVGANGDDPIAGIYLAAFTFSGAGYAASDTLWIVFNLGMEERDHDSAVAWAESHLAPAPGAMVALICGALARSKREGRQRA